MSVYNTKCDILSFIMLINHGYGSISPNNKYQYIWRYRDQNENSSSTLFMWKGRIIIFVVKHKYDMYGIFRYKNR